jgi:hypothetical protein
VDSFREASVKVESDAMNLVAWSLSGNQNNNRMERFNGEIRDREKVMRSIKKGDTPILTGYQIFHNYVRPHSGLEGKTPAEAAGVTVEGQNKWFVLIQNARRRSSEVPTEKTRRES